VSVEIERLSPPLLASLRSLLPAAVVAADEQ